MTTNNPKSEVWASVAPLVAGVIVGMLATLIFSVWCVEWQLKLIDARLVELIQIVANSTSK